MRPGRVQGKVALVTGAGSGIGKATAILLASEGAVALVADISTNAAQAVVNEIVAKGERAEALLLDVANEADWQQAIERALKNHQQLDVLVNNAGISFAKPIDEMTLDEWRKVMSVNLDGVFLGTKHAIAAMKKSGGGILVVDSLGMSCDRQAGPAERLALACFHFGIAPVKIRASDELRLTRTRINTKCGRKRRPAIKLRAVHNAALGKLRPFIWQQSVLATPRKGSRRSFLAAKAVAGRPRESVGGSLFFCACGKCVMPNAIRPSATGADFDPYFKWLGIPPAEQPPTHYRLLAIPDFTDDPEVIENAADQRMAHLRAVQIGRRADFAQQLLNEVTAAKVCLLDSGQRLTYDARLRAMTNEVSPPPIAVEPPIVVGIGFAEVQATGSSMGRKPPSIGIGILKHILGSLAGLILGYLFLYWINPRFDFLNLFSDQPPAASQAQNPAKDRSNPTSPLSELVPSRQQQQPAASVGKSETDADRRLRVAQERDGAVESGDLMAALDAVGKLADLDDGNDLEAKLAFLESVKERPSVTKNAYALVLANLLDEALASNRPELAAPYAERLLALARLLDNQDLERRATLIALKFRKSEEQR